MEIPFEQARTLAINTIAAKVLEALGGPERDAILAQAVKKSIEGWEFTTAIDKAVAAKAHEAAIEYLDQNEIRQTIRLAVYDALQVALQSLRPAMTQAFIASLAESQAGHYRSLLREKLDDIRKEKEGEPK